MQNTDKMEKRLNKIEEAAKKTSGLEITGRARPYKEIKRLHRQLDTVRKTYKRLVYSRGQITSAFEWLYDNYYILEREGRQVIRELWKCCPLPVSNGEPVVRIHAGTLCGAAAGAIDAQIIEFYIESAQKIRSFESCELSAMGLMLRAALISGAAQACSENVTEAERLLLLSDAVKTLNFLNTFDFSQIVERQSRLESVLSRDPAGIYPKMDERTRALYRTHIAKMARRRGIAETQAARQILELAEKGKTERERHVGHYILDIEIDSPRSAKRGKLYLFLIVALPALFSVLLGAVFRFWWLPFLLFLPLWE
ncbi:MAG TPA: hypothetical protein VHO66_08100, partial [Ruminiclostridium sp.]|nr:hypothetical protein [Ruminiclostridium sp.]